MKEVGVYESGELKPKLQDQSDPLQNLYDDMNSESTDKKGETKINMPPSL